MESYEVKEGNLYIPRSVTIDIENGKDRSNNSLEFKHLCIEKEKEKKDDQVLILVSGKEFESKVKDSNQTESGYSKPQEIKTKEPKETEKYALVTNNIYDYELDIENEVKDSLDIIDRVLVIFNE